MYSPFGRNSEGNLLEQPGSRINNRKILKRGILSFYLTDETYRRRILPKIN